MAKYVLETQRFILRPPTPKDVDDLAAKLFADPDVIHYLPRRDMTPRERAEHALNVSNKLWSSHEYGGWMITDKSDGSLIGSCKLEYLEETDEVGLGYAVTKALWGRGIATEAAYACVRFGFEMARLERIMAVVIPGNTASCRVLERVGFLFVKRAVYYNLDMVYYAISPEQFQGRDSFYQFLRWSGK